MKELIDRQRDDVVRTLSGRGQYRLCEPYKRLQIHPQEWVKMTPDQRKQVPKRFDDAQKDTQTTAKSDNKNKAG